MVKKHNKAIINCRGRIRQGSLWQYRHQKQPWKNMILLIITVYRKQQIQQSRQKQQIQQIQQSRQKQQKQQKQQSRQKQQIQQIQQCRQKQQKQLKLRIQPDMWKRIMLRNRNPWTQTA